MKDLVLKRKCLNFADIRRRSLVRGGGGGGKDCFINSYVMLKYYTFCPVLPDTRNSIAVFEGSQASAVCQSDKNDIEMKCSLELCKQCVPIRRSSYLTESSLSVVQGN